MFLLLEQREGKKKKLLRNNSTTVLNLQKMFYVCKPISRIDVNSLVQKFVCSLEENGNRIKAYEKRKEMKEINKGF